MGSLPLAKAGVGSAVNDTTRQVGGALGVAVLGSVFASTYGSHIVSSLRGLPSSSIAAATNSVGAALRSARRSAANKAPRSWKARRPRSSTRWTGDSSWGPGSRCWDRVVSLIWLPNRAAEAQVVEVEPALREPAFATEGAE